MICSGCGHETPGALPGTDGRIFCSAARHWVPVINAGTLVHAMSGGAQGGALCGQPGHPSQWPEGHRAGGGDKVNCFGCCCALGMAVPLGEEPPP